MAISTIKGNELKYATVSSGLTGAIGYIQNGKVVNISGQINITGALSNGQELGRGLPAALYGNVILMSNNNNSTTENVPLFITNSGLLNVKGTYSSATRALRFTGSYITN